MDCELFSIPDTAKWISVSKQRNGGTMSNPAPSSSVVSLVTSPNPVRDAEPSGRIVSAFASLAPETLLDETALAQALNVSKRTVRRMVARYELPPPVRFGGRSTWQVGRIAAWFERRAERVERDARRRSDRIE